MTVLAFIFQSVWHFLGSIVLIAVIGEAIAAVIKAFR